jgi:putative PIN family toxin of toxin-antitoxin system
VLDTNIFVSALLAASGVAAQILDLWRFGQAPFNIAVSEAILDEIEAVLRRLLVKRSKIRRLISLLRRKAILVEPRETLRVVPDEPDNRFLECAIASGAQYIVSGDNHLLTLVHAGVS